jgi:penicillin-binding protein 1A
MNRPSRVRTPVIALLAATAVALMGAAIARSRIEQAVRDRVQKEAAREGLTASIGRVRIGPWPPLRLEDVHVAKPGGWRIAVDTIDLTLLPWGRELIGWTRIALGPVTLSGPADLKLEASPTRWALSAFAVGGVRAELRAPAHGLTLTRLPGSDGDRIEMRADQLPAGQFLALKHKGAVLFDGGTVNGRLALSRRTGTTELDLDASAREVRVPALSSESTQPQFGPPTEGAVRLQGRWNAGERRLELPRWRVSIEGASASGSLSVADVPNDPRVDLSVEVERVDFARLFRTSGVDHPGTVALRLDSPSAPEDLGSAALSARIRGRLGDPASFTVSQRLTFAPPRQMPPAITALRGAFVHEVEVSGGGRKAITVSTESPDFIAMREVPPLFVRTLLIGEDYSFFGHRGIDLSELPAALLKDWAQGGAVRGASTITQQLAKNLFLSREKRMDRKLQELSLALLLEAALGKERILEIYLNVIEWGPGLYGLRPAARHYFGKEPFELSPKQMAFLVALIPGPVKYQRSFASGTVSAGFRPLVDELLAKLHSVGDLSDAEYQAARTEELTIGSSAAGAVDPGSASR